MHIRASMQRMYHVTLSVQLLWAHLCSHSLTHHFNKNTYQIHEYTHHCLMRLVATGNRLSSKRATFGWEMVLL